MSDERIYYCFCADNCKFETMTKEQILAAIAAAAAGGLTFDTDAAFITKVKEANGGTNITFWAGTQAQYNALATKEQNCLYIITDDTSKEDFEKTVKEITETFSNAGIIADGLKSEVATCKNALNKHIDETKHFSFDFNVSQSVQKSEGAKFVEYSSYGSMFIDNSFITMNNDTLGQLTCLKSCFANVRVRINVQIPASGVVGLGLAHNDNVNDYVLTGREPTLQSNVNHAIEYDGSIYLTAGDVIKPFVQAYDAEYVTITKVELSGYIIQGT